MNTPFGMIARLAIATALSIGAICFMVAYGMGHRNATTGIILCIVSAAVIKPNMNDFDSMMDRLREHRKHKARQ